MDNNMDLSSLVSLIMQNPDMIAKIAALAREARIEPEGPATQRGEVTASVESESAVQEAEPDGSETKRRNRERLFSALRPYLSSERAKTLASVEAMVAIIDSMKV